MRTKVKLKGGISLIVLVITIIVMIILAAAIILSLSNSGIIGKANKAKTDTDISNAKDLVAMAHADWMLDEAKIKENDNTITSFSNYAEKKLQEAGYKVGAGEGAYTVTEEGEVYTGLTETARAGITAGIKIGDVVKYSAVLTAKSYTTDGSERTSTGAADSTKTQTVKTNTGYTWKYIGLGEDGSLLIAPDMAGIIGTDYKLTLGDKGGYINGPKMLNTVCDALYTVEGKGKAQSMNIDLVNKLLEYNGPKGRYYDTSGNTVETAEPKTIGETGLVSNLGSNTQTPDGKDISTYYADVYYINKTNHASRITKDTVRQNLVYQANNYWLASPCVHADFRDGDVRFSVGYVVSAYVNALVMFISRGIAPSNDCAVRPYVSLISNVQKTTENGKTVWTLS